MTPYAGKNLEGDITGAVLEFWPLSGIQGLPGGIHAEPLKETPADATGMLAYATIEVKESVKGPQWSTGKQGIYYRDVLLKVRTTSKEDSTRIAGQVDALFLDAPLPVDGLMRLESLDTKTATKDGKYQQQTIWAAVVRRTAWIHWDRSQ